MRFFWAILAVFASCQSSWSGEGGAFASQIMDYQIETNQYAVVVVQDKGISRSLARKLARERAAQVTVEEGYRYYVVDSEDEVVVLQTPRADDRGVGNVYQEQIVDDNFNKRTDPFREGSAGGTFPAVRIVFKAYATDPGETSVDSCKFVNCKEK